MEGYNDTYVQSYGVKVDQVAESVDSDIDKSDYQRTWIHMHQQINSFKQSTNNTSCISHV